MPRGYLDLSFVGNRAQLALRRYSRFSSVQGVPIHGLTNPYIGDRACSRVFAHGHTFRWVKGDRYIAVMRGFCVDVRRYLILRDHLAGEVVHESPRPLVDAIPTSGDDWWDNDAIRRLGDD